MDTVSCTEAADCEDVLWWISKEEEDTGHWDCGTGCNGAGGMVLVYWPFTCDGGFLE